MTEVTTALLVKSFTSVIFTVFLQTVEVAAESFGADEFQNKGLPQVTLLVHHPRSQFSKPQSLGNIFLNMQLANELRVNGSGGLCKQLKTYTLLQNNVFSSNHG